MPATVASPIDAPAYRRDFPVLHRTVHGDLPLVFLDNAASTQRPNQVIDAMTDCYRGYYANVHRGIHTLSEQSTEAYEEARKTTAHFLNARSVREIVFTSGTTAAINLVARSWGEAHLGADDCVLLTMMEHHANIVPWHQLAERTGCRVRFAPLTDDGRVDVEAFAGLLATESPKMVAFTAVSNVLGTSNPARELTRLAHDAGATVLVDAAQAAPHAVVDVQAWDADFVAFSGHKVCGPTGIGVLYGRGELLDAMPPFLGGGAMISRVTTDGFEPIDFPYKFEAGTPPIAEAIGLDAALRYVGAVGLERIAEHERLLCQYAHERLSEIEGLRFLGPAPEHKAGIVSFALEGIHAHDIAQGLDSRGIAVRAGHHCAMPLHKALGLSASTRASFYFYNTAAEVDALADGLRAVQSMLGRKGRRRRSR